MLRDLGLLIVAVLASVPASGADAPLPETATAAPVPVFSAPTAGSALSSSGTEEQGRGPLEWLREGADWFFKRGEGEEAHRRTWGVVPLAVADSNQGFGGGVKFVEQDLFGSGVRFDTNATYTSKEFFDTETNLDGPIIARWFEWDLLVRYRDRPRLFFFGIGNATDREDRASLSLEDTLVEARLGSVIGSRYSIHSLWQFSNVNASDGQHEHGRTVSETFDPPPTGFREHAYTNAVGLLGTFDIRDDKRDPRLGFRSELGGLYHGPEIGDAPYRFGFYWVDVAVYLPLVDGGPVMAIHSRLESVDAGLSRVPFYALPQLGGTRTLRGFFEGRLRDRQAVLFQGEIRFPLWKVFSGVLFVDTGRVFRRITDPPFFTHFYVDGGAGVRFVLHPDIVVRLDVAISSEETTFMLAFGHAF